jgi:hypothetical protein
MTLGGTIESYTADKIQNLAIEIAKMEGLKRSDVRISISSGSVIATVIMPAKAAADLSHQIKTQIQSSGTASLGDYQVMKVKCHACSSVNPPVQSFWGRRRRHHESAASALKVADFTAVAAAAASVLALF